MIPEGFLTAVVPTEKANEDNSPLERARREGLLRIESVSMGGGGASLTWFKIYVPYRIDGPLGYELAMWASWEQESEQALPPAYLAKGDPIVEAHDAAAGAVKDAGKAVSDALPAFGGGAMLALLLFLMMKR